MEKQGRRPISNIGFFGITYLKQQNPYIVAWWSAVFPGFGHYLLNQYLRAMLLTLCEKSMNFLAHINEAMVYTFCGQFEMAKSVLEPRWAFAYLTVYLIAIGDSFRSALFQNKLYHLAMLENQKMDCLKFIPTGVQYLEKKDPYIGAVYSFFFPGLGQLYNHRFMLAIYAMVWWLIYISMSRMHESLFNLLLGNLEVSISMLHRHWLLFMPSVMGGSIYYSYRTTVDQNQLFRIEQRQYFSNRYQDASFRIFP